ncbi:MAG: S24 family peptidase [Gammaproteobacteria bacterium]|nr:MAG: S24 family peptidase [Gammaproteobacteria bacterium]
MGCAESEPFALRVLGDSMLPEFEEGCIIIVEPSGVLESGCYVVAQHNGEYIFRQLIIEGDRWFLKPLNERYPTLEIPGIGAIKGRVIQKAGKYRKDRKHYL